MSHPVVDLFVPHRIVKAHLEAFTSADRSKPIVAGIALFYGLPLLTGLASWLYEWHPFDGITSGLLAAAALVGSVLIAISAVLVQALLTEAARPGYADDADRRRLEAIRRVHGTVAYGSLSAFLLSGVLLWLDATTLSLEGGGSITLNAVVLVLLVHVGLSLLRVLVAADALVEAYSRIAADRVNPL